MSSLYVREETLEFLKLESTENFVDLTDEFQELQDLLSSNDLGPSETWVGVQFVGSDEVCVDIRGNNNRGKFRETGVIFLHVVDVARLGVANAILSRAESLRDLLRGRRISGTILVESVSPPNFGEGATLSFTGGYTAAVIQVNYQRDLDL